MPRQACLLGNISKSIAITSTSDCMSQFRIMMFHQTFQHRLNIQISQSYEVQSDIVFFFFKYKVTLLGTKNILTQCKDEKDLYILSFVYPFSLLIPPYKQKIYDRLQVLFGAIRARGARCFTSHQSFNYVPTRIEQKIIK